MHKVWEHQCQVYYISELKKDNKDCKHSSWSNSLYLRKDYNQDSKHFCESRCAFLESKE